VASSSAVRYGVVFALGVLFILMVVRPFVRGFMTALHRAPQLPELPRTLGELEGRGQGTNLPQPQPAVQTATGAQLPQEVLKLAEMDPEKFAAALKAWMKQGE
jgi:flagellar biosynthesis/type III secretory pathway M-ring protein FliF/YscJ